MLKGSAFITAVIAICLLIKSYHGFKASKTTEPQKVASKARIAFVLAVISIIVMGFNLLHNFKLIDTIREARHNKNGTNNTHGYA
jgi:heme/copper-type cytochrome/quinol oxidase subunit 2